MVLVYLKHPIAKSVMLADIGFRHARSGAGAQLWPGLAVGEKGHFRVVVKPVQGQNHGFGPHDMGRHFSTQGSLKTALWPYHACLPFGDLSNGVATNSA